MWLRATRAPKGVRVHPNHRAEVAHLKTWIACRAAWIDANVATLGESV